MRTINIETVLKKAGISKSSVRNRNGKLFKQVVPISNGAVNIFTKEEKVVLALQRLNDKERSLFIEALISEALENENSIEVYEGDRYSDSQKMVFVVTKDTAPMDAHIY